MRRRDLLKTAAAAAALSPGVLAASPAPLLRRVRLGDPGWPVPAEWQKLKRAVGGNLIEVHPLFAGCTPDPRGAACQDVLQHIRNPFYIGDQPAGTQVSGWLDAWTPAASAYAVKARNAADVAAAVNFGRIHNLRLVVKGGGHSYLGTSNAPDSLLIWTRAMDAVTLHDTFVPQGCEGRIPPQPAVTAEAGAMWIDLYTAVTGKAGRYVQGGGCTTVGVAGLVQSGGFGSFSKGFGTAAASLLEAEIVTADGAVRIANPCINPDLFWAMKGGGGGSWGVVTKLTLKTHDLPENFGGAAGKIQAHSDEAYRKLIAQFVRFYAAALLNPHWGEQVALAPENTLKISMVCQGLTRAETKAVWQPFFDWVSAAPKEYTIVDRLRAGDGEARHWWDVSGNDSMIRDSRPGAPDDHGWWQGDQDQVGAYLHGYDSLWLPVSLLAPTQQQRLCDALFAASRYKEVELHFNKGLAGAAAEAIAAVKNTATSPAVAEAFALAIIADGEMPAYPGFPRPAIDLRAAHKDARLIDLAAAELRKIAPEAGSYVSESNYFNARWQQDYWGANYSRLRAIKDRYDPEGLFYVHHGAGSEDWSTDGFTRTAAR
ncbi:MAG: FAD-binding oxidoreductase [Alphaproteobacteria bacterium]|nr:FAD-binding oxidoreductase [Alphaproteobacteria bacterium]